MADIFDKIASEFIAEGIAPHSEPLRMRHDYGSRFADESVEDLLEDVDDLIDDLDMESSDAERFVEDFEGEALMSKSARFSRGEKGSREFDEWMDDQSEEFQEEWTENTDKYKDQFKNASFEDEIIDDLGFDRYASEEDEIIDDLGFDRYASEEDGFFFPKRR